MREAFEGLYFLTPPASNIIGAVAQKFTTVSEIETLDLVSEGEIEGPVSGVWSFSGVEGEVGYRQALFTPFKGTPRSIGVDGARATVSPWAHSFYFNSVPVLNSNGQLNFANVDVAWTRGTPTGNQGLTYLTTQYLSRVIGEPLRQCQITGQLNFSYEYFNPTYFQDTTKTVNNQVQLEPSPSAFTILNRTSQGTAKDIESNVGKLQRADPWPAQLAFSRNYDVTFLDNVKIYQIKNRECVGCVVNFKVASLSFSLVDEINKENEAGDIGNGTVYAAMTYRPIFKNEFDNRSFWKRPAHCFAIVGKVTLGAIFPVSMSFDNARVYAQDSNFIGWEVLIFRITYDSTTSFKTNSIYIDSLSEIYNETFSYPYSAIIRSRFSAEYFQQIPERSYRLKLLKVLIPSNYDPIGRTYDETTPWDGTFAEAKAWTNNPVWCYYDMLTNPRYGLGKYLDSSFIDKWSLYQIAKYCDTLVNDGYGKLEPRFTFNWWFTQREDAYKVINDMTSTFRAMIYYGFGSIYAVQDVTKDPVYFFTNSNVEDGNFQYSSSNRKDRHTVAIIRYNDPNNYFRPALEYVEDVDGIRKYGIREIEMTAFGCSSRGQAVRLGRWTLLSETLETDMVSFVTGPEASILRPGDVFGIFDSNRKENRYAGRTRNVIDFGPGLGTDITLDSNITLHTGRTYQFNLLSPTYYLEAAQVDDLNSNDIPAMRHSSLQNFFFTGGDVSTVSGISTVHLTGNLNTATYTTIPNMVWSVDIPSGYDYFDESDDFVTKNVDYFRTIRITEKEDNKYEIGGLQYAYDKFIQVESGIGFEVAPIRTLTIPTSPSSISTLLVNNPSAEIRYIVTIPSSPVAVDSIYVYVQPDTNFDADIPDYSFLIDKISVSRDSPAHSYSNFYLPVFNNRNYYFRAYSKNEIDDTFSDNYVSSNINYVGGFDITHAQVSHLTVTMPTTGTDRRKLVSTVYNPVFSWQVSITGTASPALLAGDLPCRITIRPATYDSASGVASGVLVEETGILPVNGVYTYLFDYAKNVQTTGGPYRDFDVVVEAYEPSGTRTSAGNTLGVYTNETYTSYPGGFSIGTFVNPIQTGIELSSGIATQAYSGASYDVIAPTHSTNHWLGPNGEVVINFTSGAFNDDIVGGYIYISSGKFSKREAITANTISATGYATGNLNVYRYEFTSFNPNIPYVYHPFAGSALKGLPTGYIAVQFYDKLNAEKRKIDDNNVTLVTGLYLSNNAIITSRSDVGVSTVSDYLRVQYGFGANGANLRIVPHGNGVSGYRLSSFDKSGIETIMISNIPVY